MTSGIKCGICLVFHSTAEGDHFINTQCGHLYHNECIREWIRAEKLPTCPICREHICQKSLVKLHGISTTAEYPNGPRYQVKMVLLGDSGTGKTSFLHSFSKGKFPTDMDSTVGCDLCFKTLEVAGKVIKLSVWDCGGQDRFLSITPNYLRNVNGVCIVYDITNPESLDHLNKWLQIIYDNAPTDVSIMLVGNKADLEDSRAITLKQGQDIATELGFEFLEISAKDLTNVEAVFRTLVATVLEQFWNEGQIDSIEVTPSVNSSPISSSTCSC